MRDSYQTRFNGHPLIAYEASKLFPTSETLAERYYLTMVAQIELGGRTDLISTLNHMAAPSAIAGKGRIPRDPLQIKRARSSELLIALTELPPVPDFETQIKAASMNGMVAGYCLLIFRALESQKPTTVKSQVARPTLNVVSFVADEHNLGRIRSKGGREAKSKEYAYPKLTSVRVEANWRARKHTAPFWAAYLHFKNLQFTPLSHPFLHSVPDFPGLLQQEISFTAFGNRVARLDIPDTNSYLSVDGDNADIQARIESFLPSEHPVILEAVHRFGSVYSAR